MFGHTEILHILIGMGSAALAAAVPYPGKAFEFPARDKEVLKKKKREKKSRVYSPTCRTRVMCSWNKMATMRFLMRVTLIHCKVTKQE